MPDVQAMCEDYYELDFMDRSIDTSPIAPELARFFDEVRQRCSSPSYMQMRAEDYADKGASVRGCNPCTCVLQGAGSQRVRAKLPCHCGWSGRGGLSCSCCALRLMKHESAVLSWSLFFAIATASRHLASCLQVLFQYPFRVPAYYALILRSLTVLEGLALSADPDYKLLGAAYP